MSNTNCAERVQNFRPVTILTYDGQSKNRTNKNDIPLCFKEAEEQQNNAYLDEAFLNTTATDSVTNLWGQQAGNVTVFSNVQPKIVETGDKNSPFKLINNVIFNIIYKTIEGIEKVFQIIVNKGYKWDGASIPKWLQWCIGKNDKKEYAVASMIHDIMCEDHSKIDNNRKLSSGVFKALLKQNGTKSFLASAMSWFVDAYQAIFSNWGNKKQKEAVA